MIQTGIDLIEIDRIKKSIKNPRFLSRVFSPAELRFFSQRSFNPSTIAANFCAKEAFAKAMGTGIRGFALNEVTVLRDGRGAPYILLTGKAKELAKKQGVTLSLSLTHTHTYASAIVLAYKHCNC